MNTHKFAMLMVLVVMQGCATPVAQHSKIQQKILDNNQQLVDDARDMLAVARRSLSDIKNTPASKEQQLQQALDILTKTQSLLGAKIEDGEQFNNLTGTKLQEAIDKLYEQDKKLKSLNEQLEKKNDQAVAQMITQNIEQQAVERDHFWRNFKLYSVLTTILALIGVAMVYVPAGTFKALVGKMFGSK